MKKGILKKLFATSLIGVMSFSLVACGGEKKAEEKDMLDAIKENGKVVVGLSADYAPYEFHAMIDGKDTIVGFDIDLAKEIAKDMDVKLEIQELEFESIIAAIPAGKIDLGISGLNPDEKRKKSVDFSDIYYQSSHTILVKKENVDKFTKVEDFKDVNVGAQMGSTQQEIAEEKLTGSKVKLLSNVNNLVLELKTDKVQALVVEKPVADMIIKANPELAVGKLEFKDESGGNAVAFKKGSPKLTEQINKTIKRLKDSGELDKYIIDATNLIDKKKED
ncbi:MAG: transporter substrate-binding domain-containing protein [Clostridium sp.]